MNPIYISAITLLTLTTAYAYADSDKQILDVLYSDFDRCSDYFINEKKNFKTLEDERRVLSLERKCLMQFKYIGSATLSNMASTLTESEIKLKATGYLEENDKNFQALSAKEKFKSNNFSYGFAVVNYKDKIVDEASVVNGVLIAESEKLNEVKLILQYQALLKSTNNWEKSGHGIMLAAMLGDSDLINGFGVGYVYSIKSGNKPDGSGVSIGIGYMLENDVKQLANGFEIGKGLPPGESTPRFVFKDEISPFLFFASTF